MNISNILRIFSVLIASITLLLLSSCTPLLDFGSTHISKSPQIFNLTISPDSISSDGPTALMIEFEYFDADGDVGIQSTIDIDFESEIPLEVHIRESIDSITHHADGLSGKATKLISIDARNIRNVQQLIIRISLFDEMGHRSNVLQKALEIDVADAPPRVSACAIWFVDQPEGTPTSSYRMGREVFLMVEDLTLGLLEPDVLYAELSSPGSGWATVVPFFRTSDPHIYASRFGPRLGVSVPSTSGATLLAFYRSFTDRQEICLAQAKVE